MRKQVPGHQCEGRVQNGKQGHCVREDARCSGREEDERDENDSFQDRRGYELAPSRAATENVEPSGDGRNHSENTNKSFLPAGKWRI